MPESRSESTFFACLRRRWGARRSHRTRPRFLQSTWQLIPLVLYRRRSSLCRPESRRFVAVLAHAHIIETSLVQSMPNVSRDIRRFRVVRAPQHCHDHNRGQYDRNCSKWFHKSPLCRALSFRPRSLLRGAQLFRGIGFAGYASSRCYALRDNRLESVQFRGNSNAEGKGRGYRVSRCGGQGWLPSRSNCKVPARATVCSHPSTNRGHGRRRSASAKAYAWSASAEIGEMVYESKLDGRKTARYAQFFAPHPAELFNALTLARIQPQHLWD